MHDSPIRTVSVTVMVVSCLHDRTAVGSGAEIGLMSPFNSAIPGVSHKRTFCLH